MACKNQNKPNPEVQKTDASQEQITNDMKSFVSLFEIPAIDISRAVNFYQAILGINIEKIEISIHYFIHCFIQYCNFNVANRIFKYHVFIISITAKHIVTLTDVLFVPCFVLHNSHYLVSCRSH